MGPPGLCLAQWMAEALGGREEWSPADCRLVLGWEKIQGGLYISCIRSIISFCIFPFSLSSAFLSRSFERVSLCWLFKNHDSLAEKDMGILVYGQELAVCACIPESKLYSGLHKMKTSQQVQRPYSPHLVSFC